MRKKPDWIFCTDGSNPRLPFVGFWCERCGAQQPVTLPLSVDAYIAMCRAFEKHHKNCPESTERTTRPGSFLPGGVQNERGPALAPAGVTEKEKTDQK
jgi:hypothetical protein